MTLPTTGRLAGILIGPALAAFSALGVSPASAAAPAFPTVDRVEYVLECMKNNGGGQEFLYKCSCTIDAIAEKLPYEDYVEASTVARYQTLGGERGAVFRDPESMKALAKRYRALNVEAKQSCGVPR